MSRCWGQPPQLQKEQFWGLLPGSPVLLKPPLLFSVLLPVSMFIFPPPLLFLCLSFFSAPQCCFFLHFTVLFPVPFCSCSSVLLPHLTFLFMTCFPIPLCSSLPPSFSLVGRSLPLSLSAHTRTHIHTVFSPLVSLSLFLCLYHSCPACHPSFSHSSPVSRSQTLTAPPRSPPHHLSVLFPLLSILCGSLLLPAPVLCNPSRSYCPFQFYSPSCSLSLRLSSTVSAASFSVLLSSVFLSLFLSHFSCLVTS